MEKLLNTDKRSVNNNASDSDSFYSIDDQEQEE